MMIEGLDNNRLVVSLLPQIHATLIIPAALDAIISMALSPKLIVLLGVVPIRCMAKIIPAGDGFRAAS